MSVEAIDLWDWVALILPAPASGVCRYDFSADYRDTAFGIAAGSWLEVLGAWTGG